MQVDGSASGRPDAPLTASAMVWPSSDAGARAETVRRRSAGSRSGMRTRTRVVRDAERAPLASPREPTSRPQVARLGRAEVDDGSGVQVPVEVLAHEQAIREVAAVHPAQPLSDRLAGSAGLVRLRGRHVLERRRLAEDAHPVEAHEPRVPEGERGQARGGREPRPALDGRGQEAQHLRHAEREQGEHQVEAPRTERVRS